MERGTSVADAHVWEWTDWRDQDRYLHGEWTDFPADFDPAHAVKKVSGGSVQKGWEKDIRFMKPRKCSRMSSLHIQRDFQRYSKEDALRFGLMTHLDYDLGLSAGKVLVESGQSDYGSEIWFYRISLRSLGSVYYKRPMSQDLQEDPMADEEIEPSTIKERRISQPWKWNFTRVFHSYSR